jgi:hypothetical protein
MVNIDLSSGTKRVIPVSLGFGFIRMEEIRQVDDAALFLITDPILGRSTGSREDRRILVDLLHVVGQPHSLGAPGIGAVRSDQSLEELALLRV